MSWKRPLILVGTSLSVALIAWGAMRFYKTGAIERKSADIPVIAVKRGEVRFTVSARGDLQGGNSELLTAPMMGNAELILTSLRSPGELVKEQDVVAQFDTTEQEFKLKEAEADLAEAEQQVIMAQADSQAKAEEAEYELAQAKADFRAGGTRDPAQSPSGQHRGAAKYSGVRGGSRQIAPVGTRYSKSPGKRHSQHRDSGSSAE